MPAPSRFRAWWYGAGALGSAVLAICLCSGREPEGGRAGVVPQAPVSPRPAMGPKSLQEVRETPLEARIRPDTPSSRPGAQQPAPSLRSPSPAALPPPSRDLLLERSRAALGKKDLARFQTALLGLLASQEPPYAELIALLNGSEEAETLLFGLRDSSGEPLDLEEWAGWLGGLNGELLAGLGGRSPRPEELGRWLGALADAVLERGGKADRATDVALRLIRDLGIRGSLPEERLVSRLRVRLREDPGSETSLRAGEALYAVKGEAAFGDLGFLLDQSPPSGRVRLLRASLGAFPGPAADPLLWARLGMEDAPEVRSEILGQLTRRPEQRASVLAGFEGYSAAERDAVLQGLSESLDPAPARALLEERLLSGRMIPEEARWLPMLGKEGVLRNRFMLAQTASAPALPLSVRSACASALARVDENAAAEALAAGLGAGDEAARLQLLGHLANLPGEASRRRLDRIALSDPSDLVRGTAKAYRGVP